VNRTDVDAIGVVEAAYRFDIAEPDWLSAVLTAARPVVDEGLGAWAFVFDGHALVHGEMVIDHPTAVGLPDPNWRVGLANTLSITTRDPGVMHETVFGAPCHAMSEVLRRHARMLGRARTAIAIPGVRDSLGVCARDPSGSGVFIGAHSREILRLDPQRRLRLGRLAAHVATAFRLRRRIVGRGMAVDLLAGSEAIVGRAGRVEHAEGDADRPGSLRALREAALAIDRATRVLRRRDPDAALADWEALVEGRWSLIASFDTDGRRFLIARRNEPCGLPPGAVLSLRERQVAGYLLLGHSQKIIAYELGLSPGTVSTLAARLRAKLGARSPGDLLRTLRTLQRAGGGS